jgi:hypothetical protein
VLSWSWYSFSALRKQVSIILFILDIFATAGMKDVVPVERITSKIYLIRGQKVMLDRDLSELGTLWGGNEGSEAGCQTKPFKVPI